MAYVLPANISVWVDGSTLGCAQSASLTVTKETSPISCLGSAGATSVIQGDYSWSVSFNGMAQTFATHVGTGYEDLMDKIITVNATDVSCYIKVSDSSYYYTGKGVLTNVALEVGVGQPASYSGEITGNGVLTKVTA
jgi:hypothetical protein